MLADGLFISFEGIDGCGKTTQTKLLANYLHDNNTPHILTREPGGEPLAEKLRSLMLGEGKSSKDDNYLEDDNFWEEESEILLFLAARIQHVRRVINPALAQRKIVICDRFMDSSRIYQGVAKGLGIEFYDILHRLVLGNFQPHITFLLDIPAEIGLNRVRGRNESQDYFESMGLDFHQKLRAGFLQLAKQNPNRIITLDATLPPEISHQQITQKIKLWRE